jgi:uncharacterized protein (DUF1697 family)
MSRYVAFLRGVNLGAHRRAKSEQLRPAFEENGFEEVATFRTSGNVVFGAPGKADEESIVAKLKPGLREALGFDVAVILRSEKEVAAIAAYAPFEPDLVAATEGRLQVLLMAKKPTASVRKQALALATDRDRLAIRGRELYWLPSGGTRDSELDQEALGASLGLVTVRTKGTIEQIAAKHFAG